MEKRGITLFGRLTIRRDKLNPRMIDYYWRGNWILTSAPCHVIVNTKWHSVFMIFTCHAVGAALKPKVFLRAGELRLYFSRFALISQWGKSQTPFDGHVNRT